MNLTGIISISGKPGLYKVVAHGNNNVIVESLVDGKRFPAHSNNRISALEDISIYTYEEDIPLKDVFRSIFDKENGGQTISHKESQKKLADYMEEVLPNYDQDRVYPSDIKKLFQWYNLLQKAGALILEEETAEEVVEEAKEEKPKKAAAKKTTDAAEKTEKKAPAKKAPAKKAAAKTDEKAAPKKPAAKKTTAKAKKEEE